MSKKIFLSGCLIIILFAGYAQKKNDKPYYEDLSLVRPRVIAPIDSPKSEVIQNEQVSGTFTATKTVNEKVNFVLDSIARFNLIRRSVDGYTIQIYSGQKREDAMNVKKKISEENPELTATLQYQQPKFRVTVGKYYTRLEAYQDLSRVRNGFPSAILIPEKIAIR